MDTVTTTEHEQQEDERLASDLLVGADAILNYLILLGVLPADADAAAVYYLKRTGLWPIGNTGLIASSKHRRDGGRLIASKRRLARYAHKIAAG